jgi:hypothetical protein
VAPDQKAGIEDGIRVQGDGIDGRCALDHSLNGSGVGVVYKHPNEESRRII